VRTCGINGLALTKLDILDDDSIRSAPAIGWTARDHHLPAGEGRFPQRPRDHEVE
jgi:hypothetical protein